MNKKYIVRLTDDERDELAAVIKKLKGTSQKVRRAQILSKADADGPNWTDHRIAEAFGCRRQTVENVRQRLVERAAGRAFGDQLAFAEHLAGRVEHAHHGEKAGASLRVDADAHDLLRRGVERTPAQVVLDAGHQAGHAQAAFGFAVPFPAQRHELGGLLSQSASGCAERKQAKTRGEKAR